MHPARPFAWTEPAELRAFVAERGFAHLFVAGPAGAAVVHAPVIVADDDHLEFHIARGNRANRLIADATVIASIAGADAYVTPDWYASADQVPTWNYVAVEADGTAAALDDAGLIAHLDALSRWHERRLAPKPAWTRGKMKPGRFAAMLPGIVGYRLHVTAWRGTRKLSQNKPAGDVAGVVAGLAAAGRSDVATLVAHAHDARR